jgi:hypothetical protein
MTTRRIPIRREPVRQFSDVAVRIFQQMQRLRQRCTCLPAAIRARLCDACDQRMDLWSRLHDELHLKPYEECVEPPGPVPTWAADPAEWRKAQERYTKLAEMAGAK